VRSSFSKSWVLITGASSGLGAETARILARKGANLILSARSRDRLAELAADLGRVNGVEAHVLAEDLSAHGGAGRLLAAVSALGVEVEHLVNNAGVGTSGTFVTAAPEREAAMVRLNVESIVTLTRGLLPKMVERGRGGVINVASTAAFQPVPYMATYGATKAFVLSFTLALATELEGTGVTAMALCPGPVRTGFQAAAGIPRPGLRAAELSAVATVERGIAAYERGERVFVPGFVNGAQRLGTALLPNRVLTWATARAMKRWGRA
jgi:short-subunit dehydrogenase